MEKVIESEKLKESYYEINHDSGLKILVYPMEDYSSVYGMISVKYGSMDTDYIDECGNRIKDPMGTAHFLEHKALEMGEDDAFEIMSSLGADANAFTACERTAFYFTSTDNWDKCLETLLTHIQSTSVTKKSVDKEREIISQEIKMFEDDCDWLVYKNMLECMFHFRNLSAEPAGDDKALDRIDERLLTANHNTFYNLHNMVLILAGKVSKDRVLEIADAVLRKAEPFKVVRLYPEEPENVIQNYIEIRQTVAAPIFNLGFKIKNAPVNGIRAQMIYEILLDAIAGDSTDFYREMYEQGIINSSFDSEVYNICNLNALIFMGESRNPEKVRDLICERINYLKEHGIEKNVFDGLKKAAYGKYIGMFSSAESIANAISFAESLDEDIYSTLDIISALTADDLQQCLNECVFTDNAVLSVIKTKTEE